ncbi:MAG: DUF2188 domain-containing protein [Acholeplasmatales bacterium]|jgi:outer membrane biosynthesis protein TonB
MCFFRRKKKDKKVKEEKKVEKKVEEKPAEPKKETVAAKPAAQEKVEKKEAAKPAAKPAAKAEAKPASEVKDIYHVLLNNDEKNPNYKRWRVRKQGSRMTIQHFDTQAEAIKFAEDLAKKADGSIVIHKKDGKIRKQNY